MIFLILIASFLVRIIGVHFGLPHLYHADEPIVVNHAVAYGAGDFNPHFFKIPPLTSYVLFFIYGCFYLLGRASHFFSSVQDFEQLFLTDPTAFYLIGRMILGVLLGTLSVYLFYLLIKKHFSKRHAVISALFFGLNFLHVRDSHFIYADIPMLTILILCFFPIFRILERRKLGDYIWFGFYLGTACALKYNAVFVFAPFLTAHLLRKPVTLEHKIDLYVFVPIGVSILTFFVFNPFGLLDVRSFLNELFHQSEAQGAVGFWHHLKYSLNEGLGLPLFIVSLAGLVFSFFRKGPKEAVFLVFILVYYFILTLFSQPHDRYALPLIPFLCFFAAMMFLELEGRFSKFKFATPVLVVLAMLLPLFKIYFSDRIFLNSDVRTQALVWSRENIQANEKIALDSPFFMPPLKPTLNQLLEKEREASREKLGISHGRRLKVLIKEASTDRNSRYELYFLNSKNTASEFLFANPVVAYDLKTLKETGIRYVFFAKTHPKRQGVFYGELSQKGTLLARFSPYHDQSRQWPIDSEALTGAPFTWAELTARRQNGHTIEVYQI